MATDNESQLWLLWKKVNKSDRYTVKETWIKSSDFSAGSDH